MDEPFGGVPLLGMSLLNKVQRKNSLYQLKDKDLTKFLEDILHQIMAMRDMIKNSSERKYFQN